MSFFQLTYLKGVLEKFLIPIFILLLQACAQTTLGEKLSNSFDSPTEQKTSDNVTLNNVGQSLSTQANKKLKEKTITIKNSKKDIDKKIISSSIRLKNQLNVEDKLPKFIPQPYRITIKLSAANPSAPAETVTKALRLAGVRFEVEMIELIEKQSLTKELGSRRSKR